jgi:hypothetical protein
MVIRKAGEQEAGEQEEGYQGIVDLRLGPSTRLRLAQDDAARQLWIRGNWWGKPHPTFLLMAFREILHYRSE